MAASNEIKIIIGGDASTLTQASQQSVAAVNDLQKSVSAASAKIDAAANSINQSFDEIGASKAAMDRIAASIDAAAAAATKAGPKFDSLGGRLPLDDMNKFNSAINQLKKDLASGFKPTIINPNFIPPSVPPTLEKVQAKSKQAGAAILDFSRIVQDAPYAANNFGSIANNIDPAVQSYTRLTQEAQRLSAETGKNVTTFSLLKQSLMGGAGIGLAISAVTSIMTAAQMKYGSLGAAINSLVGSTSIAAQAQRDLNKSFAEAEGTAAGEIANINALLAVARNETLSKQARAEAINKLNEQYDAYLPKLSQENINTQAVTESVNKLTASLIRQAKIKGVQDLISKETAKQAELFAGSIEDNASAWGNIVAAVKSLRTGGNFAIEQQIAGAKQTGAAYQSAQTRIEAFNKALNELTKEEAVAGTLFDETKGKKDEDFLKKQLDLIEKIRDSAKEFQGKLFDLKNIDEATDSLASLEQKVGDLKLQIAVRDAQKAKLPAVEIEKLKDAIKQDTQKRVNEAFDKEALLLEFPKLKFSQINRLDTTDISGRVFTLKEKVKVALDGSNIELQKIPVDVTDLQEKIARATGLDKKIAFPTQFDIDLKFNGKEFADKMKAIRDQIASIQQTIIGSILNGIADASVLIGESFGSILSGENAGSALAKAAQGMLGIVGSILQEVGKQILLTSKLVGVLKKAISNLFKPGGEIIAAAVGVALIASGALLKNLKFNVPKLADGGIATKATLGIFGEAGREAIIPLNKLPEMVGKLSTDNQQPIIINGNMRINGTDLQLMLERVTSRRSRLG
jgi:hypothetical protein